MRVAVTGASGLIGSALVPHLARGGHDVVRLVRRESCGEGEMRWDPAEGPLDVAALEGVESVVHLSGESLVAGRWSPTRKVRLRDSRIGSTRRLARALASMRRPPSVLISASAIGYYGSCGDQWLTETSPAGDDFLPRLTVDWEKAADPAAEAGIHVAHPRLGLVLSPAGGVLGKMLLPFRAGLGGIVGPGTQYMSWITMDDVLGSLEHVLLGTQVGALNVVAPAPVTNRAFTVTLGRVLRRPTFAPVPAFALRWVLGEMADATPLASARVSPARLRESGCTFQLPALEGALRRLLQEEPG